MPSAQPVRSSLSCSAGVIVARRHVREELGQLENERLDRAIRMPDESLREDLGTGVVAPPPFDRLGGVVDDPVLRNTMLLVFRPFLHPIVTRGTRRDGLDREDQV